MLINNYIFYIKFISLNYLRLNLERAIDSLFHPEDYNLNLSYLDQANIAYGLPLSGLAGLGARLSENLGNDKIIIPGFSKVEMSYPIPTPNTRGGKFEKGYHFPEWKGFKGIMADSKSDRKTPDPKENSETYFKTPDKKTHSSLHAGRRKTLIPHQIKSFQLGQNKVEQI